MVVPKPFSRALFAYGEPILVPRDGDVEEWRQRIERAMNDLAAQVDLNFDELWRDGER